MTTVADNCLVSVLPPALTDHEVTFRWKVEPPSPLYRKSEFTLKFPAEIDLTKVPEGLWWRIALICLHSQWPLLRPCRVELPIRLFPGERDAWTRLVDAQIDTLEGYRRTARIDGRVDIVEGVFESGVVTPTVDRGQCATSFSGGKDSLVQTGLLCELTEEPVLVTTTSPMASHFDHQTKRRRQILTSISQHPGLRLIEVESDYRANSDQGFAQSRDYQLSVNELSDTFLYLGSLVAVAASLGISHLFLASEREVQENVEIDGRVVQHRHYMYSVVTQNAIRGILRPWGIQLCSLTAPLHSYQVQELLTKRYTDLRDLQYSCWRVGLDEMACNSCTQCLRVAFSLLSLGVQPSLIGMDIAKILRSMNDWIPKGIDRTDRLPMPDEIVSARLHAQVMRSVLSAPESEVLKEIGSTNNKWFSFARGRPARASYRRLRRIAQEYSPGAPPGYCPGFLEFVDPLLRARVGEIYDQHFSPETSPDADGVFARCRGLSQWILDPLTSTTMTPMKEGDSPR